MIDTERMEKALHYLATTDDAFAELKVKADEEKVVIRRAMDRGFIEAEGSVAERTALSRLTADVSTAETTYFKTLVEYEKMKALRERAAIVIDVWRSLESSRRAGLNL